LLGNRNGWWRTTAQRLLVERLPQDRPREVMQIVAVVQESPNTLARLHALWTLVGIGNVHASLVRQLALDPHPGLREHAIRVATAIQPDRFERLLPTEMLIVLSDDPAIRVRFQAALALGDRCPKEPAALHALARLAARDAADPWIRLAILSGLSGSAPGFIASCDAMPASEGRSVLLSQCAAIVGARRVDLELAALLGEIAGRSGGNAADAMTLLAGLAVGLEHSGIPVQRLVVISPTLLREPFERLAPLWPIASTTATSSRPEPERLAALDVLARCRPDLAEEVVPGLLAVDQPRAIQVAAARAVARVGRPSLADKALDRWESLALATRRELISALAGSPALAEPLIRAMEREVVAPRELDAATREGLRHLVDPALRSRAATVLAKYAPPRRSAVIDRYQPALKLAGDPVRGRAVFARNCQTCHQHQGQGNRVGPDLSGIAGRAPDALLSDILDPNKNVEPDYLVLAAATRRGQVYSGLLAGETATTVKLRRAEGVEDTLLRSEIDELRSTGQSLMPEGLERDINLPEMADLIAFLRRGG
jgi:putative heme-binding domain-containing protein